MSAQVRKNAMPWCAATAAIVCVLGLYQSSGAQSRPPELPFANAVEQRIETVNQLKELNAQMKELNALMRSGKLQVVVAKEGAR